MGLMDLISAAVPGAIAARSGYLQGQDQEQDKQNGLKRQSLLDQMKQKMDQSTMDEQSAHGDYYRGIANAKQDAESPWGTPYETNRGFVQYNKHTGGNRLVTLEGDDAGSGGSDATGANDLAGGDIATSKNNDAGSGTAPTGGSSTGPLMKVVKDATKQYDTFTDANGKVWNRNTHDPNDVTPFTAGGTQIMGHVPREPRDPNAPPVMNLHTKEETAKQIADEAVSAAGGDARQAMANMERPGEKERAVAAGMTGRHYVDAAARFARQKDQDAMRTRQNSYLYPPKRGAAVSTPPATPAGQPTGNINLGASTPLPTRTAAPTGDGSTSMAPAAASSAMNDPDSAKAAEVMRRIEASKGAISPKQALMSDALNANVKALVRRRYGLPPG
jgi:hypothetical protein